MKLKAGVLEAVKLNAGLTGALAAFCIPKLKPLYKRLTNECLFTMNYIIKKKINLHLTRFESCFRRN